MNPALKNPLTLGRGDERDVYKSDWNGRQVVVKVSEQKDAGASGDVRGNRLT